LRTVKEANERKNEILDVAKDLFMKQGYNQTNTNEIVKAVGIARGTLYYHFKSKEEIMDAIIVRQGDELVRRAENIADDKMQSVFERIFNIIMSLKIEEQEQELVAHIHRPENALMHQRIEKMIVEKITPILTEVILEGIEEGVFKTAYPYECVEMILIYANTAFDEVDSDYLDRDLRKKVNGFIYNLERLLGCKSGSLDFIRKTFEV
jgi:AcrR family transcriptional regulator